MGLGHLRAAECVSLGNQSERLAAQLLECDSRELRASYAESVRSLFEDGYLTS